MQSRITFDTQLKIALYSSLSGMSMDEIDNHLNRTFARFRHLNTTTRIHHVLAFWCKFEFLLFKPRGEIAKFKYERQNEMNSCNCSQMRSSCKCPITHNLAKLNLFQGNFPNVILQSTSPYCLWEIFPSLPRSNITWNTSITHTMTLLTKWLHSSEKLTFLWAT